MNLQHVNQQIVNKIIVCNIFHPAALAPDSMKGQPRLWRYREYGKVVEGISRIKKHIAEKGREHRFFYPINTLED
jgi:hypothetical protein